MWISGAGGDERYVARKHLLVLGGDPKPKQKVKEENYISKKKPRPLYNHCQWAIFFFSFKSFVKLILNVLLGKKVDILIIFLIFFS